MTDQQIELNNDLDFTLALDESAISPTEHFDSVINSPEIINTPEKQQQRLMSKSAKCHCSAGSLSP